jgi:putative membrane protein insertion efficiency factor
MRETMLHLPQRLLILLVRGYRLLLSPWLGSQCRFEPTCSAYALGALQAHGAAGGTYLTARRVLRCHPWCAGGHDPVPSAPPRLFAWLASAAVLDKAPGRPKSPCSPSGGRTPQSGGLGGTMTSSSKTSS